MSRSHEYTFGDPDKGPTMEQEDTFALVHILSIGSMQPSGIKEVSAAIMLENREVVLPHGTQGDDEHVLIGGEIHRLFQLGKNIEGAENLKVGAAVRIEHHGKEIHRVFVADLMTVGSS